MVRLRDVQGGMRQTVFLVGVIAGTKHLLFRQDRCNPAGAIARGTQGEDSFHNGSGFLVYDQLFVLQVFDIKNFREFEMWEFQIRGGGERQ